MRQTALFYKAEPDYGQSVANGLGLDPKTIERLAGMSQEDRARATAKGTY
jgi:catalase